MPIRRTCRRVLRTVFLLEDNWIFSCANWIRKWFVIDIFIGMWFQTRGYEVNEVYGKAVNFKPSKSDFVENATLWPIFSVKCLSQCDINYANFPLPNCVSRRSTTARTQTIYYLSSALVYLNYGLHDRPRLDMTIIFYSVLLHVVVVVACVKLRMSYEWRAAQYI